MSSPDSNSKNTPETDVGENDNTTSTEEETTSGVSISPSEFDGIEIEGAVTEDKNTATDEENSTTDTSESVKSQDEGMEKPSFEQTVSEYEDSTTEDNEVTETGSHTTGDSSVHTDEEYAISEDADSEISANTSGEENPSDSAVVVNVDGGSDGGENNSDTESSAEAWNGGSDDIGSGIEVETTTDEDTTTEYTNEPISGSDTGSESGHTRTNEDTTRTERTNSQNSTSNTRSTSTDSGVTDTGTQTRSPEVATREKTTQTTVTDAGESTPDAGVNRESESDEVVSISETQPPDVGRPSEVRSPPRLTYVAGREVKNIILGIYGILQAVLIRVLYGTRMVIDVIVGFLELMYGLAVLTSLISPSQMATTLNAISNPAAAGRIEVLFWTSVYFLPFIGVGIAISEGLKAINKEETVSSGTTEEVGPPDKL